MPKIFDYILLTSAIITAFYLFLTTKNVFKSVKYDNEEKRKRLSKFYLIIMILAFVILLHEIGLI
jgi:hypothetical protein